jgi:arylamine N-acetyltransferase
MTAAHAAVDRLLGHLHLRRERPTLGYLHRIIRAHQRRVPFETLTKLIDYEPGLRRGDFIPPMAEYVDRIIARGGGGLCWTLAQGLQVLLDDLAFDASLMYMAPGHCCVRVELPEGPFYADVGYAAPIFQAYPLFESFTLVTHRERFDYRVGDEGIFVTRNPGPTKQLDPTPRRIEELGAFIRAANDWSAPQSFLHRIVYARYVAGTYTSFQNNTLRRYVPGGVEQTAFAEEHVPRVLATVFGVDPALCRDALDIHRRYSGPQQ